jgi:hypothetical protein
VKYGSRKFLLALLTIVSSTAMLVLGLLPASVYAQLVGAALALYMVGNVGQKTWAGDNADKGTSGQ